MDTQPLCQLAQPGNGELAPGTGLVVIYARVSTKGRIDDINSQIALLSAFASKKDLRVSQVVWELGSGPKFKRPKLVKLLKNPNIQTILVEKSERITRYGFECVEASLAAQGRVVLVANP